ncbi:MAG: hypothetical protein ACYTDU_20445, partial [Planctomycetota bacterium]
MWRIVGVLLLFLPARAGEGEVRLPVDDEVAQALALARKHARAGAWKRAAAVLQDIATGDSEAVHSENGVLYYPVRDVARRRLARMPAEIRKTLPRELFAAPREDPAVRAPARPVAPDLPGTLPRRPFWSFGLAERDPRLWAAYYGMWAVILHDREPSVVSEPPDQTELGAYPTVRPVVSEGAVLYRDYVEMVARGLGSGAMLKLHTRYSPPDLLADPQHLYPLRRVRPYSAGMERVYRYLDYGGNTITVGEGSIVLVEQRQIPADLRTAAPIPPRPNLL